MRTPRLIADRYFLVEPLAGSAIGGGWRAQDLWSGQLVVTMLVPMSTLVDRELARARHEIASEVRVLGGLQHDRLARAMDVVLKADDLWVVSEPLPAVTLADELARRGAVGPEEVARWGRDVAEGLAAAHGIDVAHRNLPAGMVGLAEDGGAVVGGFATTVVTLEGLRNGTPVHVAPEVARGAKPSPAGDVFALGVLLYIAVEGRGPFPAAADRDQLLAAVTADAVAAPQRPGRLSDPLMRMLHPDPAQRPAAAAVADQFRQLVAVPGAGDSVTTRLASPEPSTTRVTSGERGSSAARLAPGPPVDVPADPPAHAPVGPPPFGAPSPWAAPPPRPGSPPTVTEPAAARRKRRWWVAAAAVVRCSRSLGDCWSRSGHRGLRACPVDQQRPLRHHRRSVTLEQQTCADC